MITFGERGLIIRGVAFSENGPINGVAFGESDLISGMAYGERGRKKRRMAIGEKD